MYSVWRVGAPLEVLVIDAIYGSDGKLAAICGVTA
jgi:hypothetical protein